ncbi:conjugative transposon protein TraM [Desertivirga xinjiangensis]|uniref:conjugative transposon protein TraM n=1 Tax=Desertivirga xinjiangensis TaxID=539206 RepID=UPI00210A359E|nr:conjugative transposon protein TraM [Pedobacter xinjiangensis]
MKINFQQPKYVLPVIVLPFIFIFFYLYKGNFDKPEEKKNKKVALQENISDVSEEVKKQSLEDKLATFRQRYKDGDGLSALGEIEEDEHSKDPPLPDLESQKEKRLLDSINQSIKTRWGTEESYSSRKGSRMNYGNGNNSTSSGNNELSRLLRAMNQNKQLKASAQEQDPMAVFRQQMALIDSMGKANDPEFKAEQARKRQVELAEKEKKEQKVLAVKKYEGGLQAFNTVRPNENRSLITAIVDEDIKGYAGSRLRIRLLEDLLVGRVVVKSGTYLYAQISGFNAQRVSLTINSILVNNLILPVKLEIYDRDGMPGLFVPASAFREFQKELGNSSVQGINLQNQIENNSQLFMSLMQKVFQSSSAALSKLIRQNKAEIKYNTQVFLVDPAELKNNQKNY